MTEMLSHILFMKFKKKIIIIPGMGGTSEDETSTFFKSILGESCIIFSPTWKYRTSKDWVKEYEDFVIEKDLKNFVAFGFSMGAYILACSSVVPDRTVYGSLSPFFKEYISSWSSKELDFLGKKRVKDMGVYISKPNSYFLYGEKEDISVLNISIEKSKNKNVFCIKDSGHDILNKDYINKVISLLES